MISTKQPGEVEILIVGASIAGLSLAALLSVGGIRGCLVVGTKSASSVAKEVVLSGKFWPC